jgi:hypothetical protein
MAYQWRKPVWAWFSLAFILSVGLPLAPFKNEAFMTMIAAPAAVVGCVGAMIAAFRAPKGSVSRAGLLLRFVAAGGFLAILTPLIVYGVAFGVDALQTGMETPTAENVLAFLAGMAMIGVFGGAFGLAIGVPWSVFAGIVFAFLSLRKTKN